MKAGDIELAKLARARGWISDDVVRRALREADRCQAMGLEKAIDEILVEEGNLGAEQARALRDALGISLRQPRVGDYEVIRRIGVGGMGTVFEALHVRLRQRIALKILQPRLAKDPLSIDRFLKEARILARLNHPHLVHAVDAGQDGDHYFLAMEYIEGENLLQLLLRTGPLEALRSCEIVRDVCAALELLESKGLVHRDVKPANVLLRHDGVVKLADLGLMASVSAAAGQPICGTPHYIPPERWRRDGDMDGRGDIYSLGATWYHILVGRPPFTGKSTREIMQGHLEADPIAPSRALAGVPAAVDRVLLGWLARDRARRPQSARDARLEVEALMVSLGRRSGGLLSRKGWILLSALVLVALAIVATRRWNGTVVPVSPPTDSAADAHLPPVPPVITLDAAPPVIDPGSVASPVSVPTLPAGVRVTTPLPGLPIPERVAVQVPKTQLADSWRERIRTSLTRRVQDLAEGRRWMPQDVGPLVAAFKPLRALARTFHASFVALSPGENYELSLRYAFDEALELDDFRSAPGSWKIEAGALEAGTNPLGEPLWSIAWFTPPIHLEMELEREAAFIVGHGTLRLAPGHGHDARIWQENAENTPVLAAPVSPGGRLFVRFLDDTVEWGGAGFVRRVEVPPAGSASVEPGAGRLLFKLAARQKIIGLSIQGRLHPAWARERVRHLDSDR